LPHEKTPLLGSGFLQIVDQFALRHGATFLLVMLDGREEFGLTVGS
jgi:hypothetical protein